MAKAPEIQDRFDGGEISPRLSGRFSADLYKKALRECTNFEPLPQGSMRMRSGSGMQLPLTGDIRTRLMAVRMSTGEDFILEFLEKKMNIYAIDQNASTAEIDVSATPSTVGQSNLILNGSFSTADGDKWQGWPITQAHGAVNNPANSDPSAADTETADINSNFNQNSGLGPFGPWLSFRALGSDHLIQSPTVQLGYAALRTGGEQTGARHRYTTVMFQKIQVPFNGTTLALSFKAAISPGCSISIKLSSTDPSTWAGWDSGGELFSYRYGLAGGEAIRNLGLGDGQPNPPALTSIANVPGMNTAAQYAVAAAGFYWISLQIEEVPQGSDNFLELDDIVLQATYTIPGTIGGTLASIPTPWTANEVEAVQFTTETGRDRTIFVHGDHNPWFLLYGGILGNWQFGNITFVNLPLGWGDQGSTNVPVSWNWLGLTDKLAKANWPEAVDFHDGRVLYGGEKAQGNRILASKAGSSDDFTLASGPSGAVLPGDALDFKLSTKGKIKWLASNRTSLAATDLGVHSIQGSTGPILAGDIQARQEFECPSGAIQAVTVGIYAAFVSSDLRQIYATTFEFQSAGLEPRDLTFSAEHMTKPLIKELHHARSPVNILPAVLKDGTLLMLTFEANEQVLAGWRVDVGGTVCSACVTQGTLGAYLWLAVARTTIGPIQENLVPIGPTGPTTTIYLEKFQLSENSEFIRYLDFSQFFPSDANGNIIGANYVAGKTVRVVGTGGSFVGDFVVGENGVIALGEDFTNGQFYIGLPFLARAVTMSKDLRTGKGQTPKIGTVLNNSAYPKITGSNPNSKPHRSKDRDPNSPMGHASPLFTGKKNLGNLGWSEDEVFTIEQDLPLRTEVCAIYSKLEIGEE